MAKISLTGVIAGVGEVGTVGANNTKRQYVIFHPNQRTDDFGKPIGKPEQWQITVLGNKVDELNLDEKLAGTTATVNLYINSFFVPGRNPTETGFYSVENNLHSINY